MIGRDDLSRLLGALCPMFLLLDAQGVIDGAGPTLRKLRPDADMTGVSVFDLFDLTRPRAIRCMDDLVAAGGTALRLRFRDPPQTAFKGMVVPLPSGQGAVVNLSFGISIIDAVRDHALNGADFPVTDLTTELLYLVEAKSAAMEASRKLNLRLQGAMIAAEEQAFTDTLTGLKNRRALEHVMPRLVASGAPFALLHLDLDYFKAVNDTFGHAAGDVVLQQAARIMVAATREEDTVARVGGDEFVLILNRQTDRERVARIAARLIRRLERPIPCDGHSCNISASIGIAFSGDGAVAPDDLLHRADLALYAAKRAGRAQFQFHDADRPDSLAPRQVESGAGENGGALGPQRAGST